MSGERDWLLHLPPSLVNRAYRSENEFAWERKDAIQVVEALQDHGFFVLGVDIWIPTNPGPTIPTPYVYDWDLFATSVGSAVEFIRGFEWADDDAARDLEPFFNLTVAKLDA